MLLTPEFLVVAGHSFLRVLGIILGAMLILKLFGLLVNRAFIPSIGSATFPFDEKRARTLGGLLQSIIRYMIYFVAIIMVLQEFKIDTTSLVAGAGIVGLALGVGAQSLIRDLITGFFIVLENQFAVGDYIVSGDMGGTVEDIGLRVTKLRDSNGVLHIIPHGAIVRVTNFTRGHMQASVTIPISYEEDLQKVLALLEEACIIVKENVSQVVEIPKVVGIVDWRGQELLVRLVAKTLPLEQVKVETALRYQIKTLFEAANIKPPTIR